MRGSGVAVLGAIGLVACLLITLFMAWGPLILASVASALIALGVGLGGLKARCSPFRIPPIPSGLDATRSPVLHGINVNSGVERGQLLLNTRNVPVLGAITALCGATLAAYAWAGVPYTATLEVDQPQYLVFYALTYLGIVPLIVAAAWAHECFLLRVAAVTVGFVQTHLRQRFLGLWTRYEFRDPQGEYFGGTSHNYDKAENDNLVFVFFLADNPTINAASCSLMFHRVRITVPEALKSSTAAP